MGNLFTSLINSANTIQVYGRQLATIQNNVANANTPGYVRQTQTLEALPMNLAEGLPGGVTAGPLVSSRSSYAEQAVRSQFSQLGFSQQKAGDLDRISSLFDLTSDAGVAGSIGKFFQSFSQLSVTPNDSVARQFVLDNAKQLTNSFQRTASGLGAVAARADDQVRETVTSINRLAGQIRDLNVSYRQNFRSTSDAGLDARVHATLEQLSEFGDFSITRAPDGSMSVYLGGQTPLVIGDHQFQITADFSSPQTAVLDSSGVDITSQVQYGRLAAALQEKNQIIPSYTSDLNTLAKSLADQVNQQLAAGVDINGSAPASPLFVYNATAGAASSLSLGTLTSDQLAAATPQAPGGNGNALNVADLLSAKTIAGSTFTECLGRLGSRIGRDISNAKADTQTQKGLLSQARSLRDEVSGVSLDEEAAHILEVQRAYQASGKVMTVLNEIMDTLMQTLR